MLKRRDGRILAQENHVFFFFSRKAENAARHKAGSFILDSCESIGNGQNCPWSFSQIIHHIKGDRTKRFSISNEIS